MSKEYFKLDLVTQRFIKNRWETKSGMQAREKIIAGIENSSELRSVLDDYILDDSENSDPYAYPIYPKKHMRDDKFWVISQDDLRGIVLNNKNFSYSRSLEKKALAYSSFYNCDLSNADIQMSDLSFSRFEKCNMQGAFLPQSGGYNIRFLNCNLNHAHFDQSGFHDCDFSGSVFNGAHFKGAQLENIKVNYKSCFDKKLQSSYETYGCHLTILHLADEYTDFSVVEEKAISEKKAVYRLLYDDLNKEWFVVRYVFFKKQHFSLYNIDGLSDLLTNKSREQLNVIAEKKISNCISQYESERKSQKMPEDQKPEILRAIRIAYKKAELWSDMDSFLYEEKKLHRKHILWRHFVEQKSLKLFLAWLTSFISYFCAGYSTKPQRVILISLLITVCFSFLYICVNIANINTIVQLKNTVFYSFSTFINLSTEFKPYNLDGSIMKILTIIEAWVGIVLLSLFVVVLARKLFR